MPGKRKDERLVPLWVRPVWDFRVLTPCENQVLWFDNVGNVEVLTSSESLVVMDEQAHHLSVVSLCTNVPFCQTAFLKDQLLKCPAPEYCKLLMVVLNTPANGAVDRCELVSQTCTHMVKKINLDVMGKKRESPKFKYLFIPCCMHGLPISSLLCRLVSSPVC